MTLITEDPQFLADDMIRLDHGDAEIKKQLEVLRALHKKKGLPYRELCASRLFNGNVKYILKEHNGTFTICDLDTNEEVRI